METSRDKLGCRIEEERLAWEAEVTGAIKIEDELEAGGS